jgi:uncharacterized protein (DUF58 family)
LFTASGTVGVAGIITGRPLVAACGGLLLTLWVAAAATTGRSIRNLAVTSAFERAATDFEQPVTLRVTLANRSRWPVPLVQWSLTLPAGLELLTVGDARPAPAVATRLSLAAGEAVTFRVSLRGRRRGRYVLGPCYLAVRDPLGLTGWDRQDLGTTTLTVFPQQVQVRSVGLKALTGSGSHRGPPWNPPDPTRFLGVRPYEPGDPPRYLHPYASARLGSLQIKRFETEAQHWLELVMVVSAGPAWQGLDTARGEAVISVAATLADDFLRQGIPVGLTVVGAVIGRPRGVRLSPQRGPAQRQRIQTALAWVMPGGGAEDFETACRRLAREARGTGHVVVVAGQYVNTWAGPLQILRRRAGVTWVAVGVDAPAPQVTGVGVTRWNP